MISCAMKVASQNWGGLLPISEKLISRLSAEKIKKTIEKDAHFGNRLEKKLVIQLH